MEGIDCRATEHTTAQLCDVITCIGGKIVGWEKTGVGENWGWEKTGDATGPSLEPRLHASSNGMLPTICNARCWMSSSDLVCCSVRLACQAGQAYSRIRRTKMQR